MAAPPLKVVLCDDAPELRELTRYVLEEDPGISVTGEAGDALECFAIVRATPPDVVLLDLAMPGIDGLEAIPELRRIDPKITIVVFSGFDSEGIAERAIECGADRYVQKGTALAEIRTTLKEAVAERRGMPAPSLSEVKEMPSPLDSGAERFRILAKLAPVGIYETDPVGLVTFVNPRWAELAGIPPKQALGSSWTETIHPEDRDDVIANWQQSLSSGRPFRSRFRFVGREGRVSSEALAITDSGGALIGYLGTVVDDTERHVVEERLRGTAAELQSRATALQRSNADLEQFAYVASHDLSEPLRVVIGFIELLQNRYGERLDDEGRGFIKHAMSSAERLQRLIDDLLAYSRLGGIDLARQEISSADLVSRLVAELKAATETDAEVTVGELPVLSAEPQLLERVFQNLLSNAVKFAGTPAKVEVSAEREKGAWRFDVRDNGPGVAESGRERIFEMFQRLHGREVPGTGIGLAICRRAVERHGGRIWCESAPGGGSTFSFTIPDEMPG